MSRPSGAPEEASGDRESALIELPLFPLNAVLFPEGLLPLRIFEPRYLTMISHCLREARGFGAVLIRTGSEIGTAETHTVGTIAEIVDWHRESDGILGVTAEGRDRFRIVSNVRQSDGLYVGEVELLGPEPEISVPEHHLVLARVLRAVIEELGDRYPASHRNFEDASWVGYRLAEILPLAVSVKQRMLELTDAEERLEMLQPHIEVTSE